MSIKYLDLSFLEPKAVEVALVAVYAIVYPVKASVADPTDIREALEIIDFSLPGTKFSRASIPSYHSAARASILSEITR